MKKLPLGFITLFALFIVLAPLLVPHAALATGPLTINGKWAGTAFAAPFDLNSDGIPARTFDFRAYNQLAFVALQGIADTTLIALPGQGTCSDPNALELAPQGRITFRGFQDNAAYAVINSTPHLCFNPANPNEVLSFTVIGGTGIYAGKTGSGTATLHDTVLEVGPTGALLMIDSLGEFTLTVQ